MAPKYWFCSFLPASKSHVEIKVKFDYGSRLPVLFWCTIFFFLKYRHITLAKDYTLITFPKGRYAANMQRFHSFNLAHGTKFCSYYLCISICCADFVQFY